MKERIHGAFEAFRSVVFASALLCAALSCGGCGDDKPPPAPTPTPIDASTLGGAKGTVRFLGKEPARFPLTMGTDVCREFPRPDDPTTGLVKNGLVQNAFVRIAKGLEGKVFARPETPVESDQTGCMFSPRVVGVMSGQWMVFKNSDATAHNVRVVSKNRGTNRTLASKGNQFPWWFPGPEADPIVLKCDVHPWMTGYVFVVDHPFFATTGEDGSFTWTGIPAGSYVVEAWNEAFGTTTGTLVVEAGKEASVELAFKGEGAPK
jgi:plastocyanin